MEHHKLVIVKNKVSRFERALIIKRTLGTKSAAYFLKKLGFSLEASLWILFKLEVRTEGVA